MRQMACLRVSYSGHAEQLVSISFKRICGTAELLIKIKTHLRIVIKILAPQNTAHLATPIFSVNWIWILC